MAYIDCVVDTNPMANEISKVSRTVTGTTAAVVAMRAAVIKAENEGAEHVCQNVNKGFYTLIRSQISQKIAKLRSEVDSHIMKLNQHRKQLLAIKGRMEKDYAMISSRYYKIFSSLNKLLDQRIYELDRPAIDFAVRDVNTFANRTRHLSATIPVSQQESVSVSQKILASNIKYRGVRLIESMTNFLNDVEDQRVLTDRILLSSSLEEPEAAFVIPVVIAESCSDKFGNRQENIYVNTSCIGKPVQNMITNVIGNAGFEWQTPSETDADVNNEFFRYLSDSDIPQRVKDMMASMFRENNYQTIKSVQL